MIISIVQEVYINSLLNIAKFIIGTFPAYQFLLIAGGNFNNIILLISITITCNFLHLH